MDARHRWDTGQLPVPRFRCEQLPTCADLDTFLAAVCAVRLSGRDRYRGGFRCAGREQHNEDHSQNNEDHEEDRQKTDHSPLRPTEVNSRFVFREDICGAVFAFSVIPCARHNCAGLPIGPCSCWHAVSRWRIRSRPAGNDGVTRAWRTRCHAKSVTLTRDTNKRARKAKQMYAHGKKAVRPDSWPWKPTPNLRSWQRLWNTHFRRGWDDTGCLDFEKELLSVLSWE